MEEEQQSRVRARVDLRSLICLEQREYLASDQARVVILGQQPDGQRIESMWPRGPDAPDSAWQKLRKWAWAFQGDDEAIHAWEGELAHGQVLSVSAFVLRPRGSSDAELVAGFADAAQQYGPELAATVAGIAASAIVGSKLPPGTDKVVANVARQAAAAAAKPVAKATARFILNMLASDAVKQALDRGAGEHIGAVGLSVRNEGGVLQPIVQMGPGVRRDGWRRAVWYPSPSKSGKTLRLTLTGAGAKYGVELQVRNLSLKTPDLPNGVCHVWNGSEAGSASVTAQS